MKPRGLVPIAIIRISLNRKKFLSVKMLVFVNQPKISLFAKTPRTFGENN